MIQFFLVQLKAQAKLKKCLCKVLKTSGVIALNPLLSPPGGGLFTLNTFEGGGGRSVFNLEKTMVSVLHIA